MDTLQKLYDSEINFAIISCFWDGGFTAKLGDELNGFIWEQDELTTLDLAVDALVKAVLDAYPESAFAKNYAAA